ncbi:MAG: hypothetical protein A2231_12800 [Candidatus Firestonebacteria bacterium RIFOXYA2_FULL_40_8]|nr:MAG: hypothetical protein A2231_12800 [Candidatus Firestonebacteria bacterium RIFOXYA2_FULL_40_8]
MRKLSKLRIIVTIAITILVCLLFMAYFTFKYEGQHEAAQNIQKCKLLKIGMTRSEVKGVMRSTPKIIDRDNLTEQWVFEAPRAASTFPSVLFNKKTGKAFEIICDDSYRITDPKRYEELKKNESKTAIIPKDLDDCFIELNRTLDLKVIEEIKNKAEKDMIDYHMGLGMWIRNNWIRQKDSRLGAWFVSKGIHHPDDMSGIILDSYWRHLHNHPVKLDEQIKYYQDYWKKEK